MRFLMLGRSVGRIEKKKPKKMISRLGIGGLVPQHNSCGARKTLRREPKVNMAEKLVNGCCKSKTALEKRSTTRKLLCYDKMA